jgi:hypothetical protein
VHLGLGRQGEATMRTWAKVYLPPLNVAPEPKNTALLYARYMAKDKAGKDSHPRNQIGDREVQEMIDSGDILEADGNLWEIALPTFEVKGRSASEQLIEERASY